MNPQKTLSASLAIITITLSTTPNTYAQSSTSTATTSATSTETIESRQENREAIRTERQAALGAARQERVLNLAANLSNRFDAASGRLLAIVTRLESRLNKLNAAGFDTTDAATELRIASDHLASVRTVLSNIDKQVSAATTSTEPQNKWADVRQTYQTAATSLRSAQASLKLVVELLKNASTTPSVEPATSTSTPAE